MEVEVATRGWIKSENKDFTKSAKPQLPFLNQSSFKEGTRFARF